MKKIIDSFCGAGGCSIGYVNAGLQETGVDIFKKNYHFLRPGMPCFLCVGNQSIKNNLQKSVFLFGS